MKAAVVYYSGTGNTERAGDVFKTFLEEENYKVDKVDISRNKKQLRNYDLIVVGTPTYASSSTHNMKKHLDLYVSKENNPKAKAITFVTYGLEGTCGHIILKNYMEKRGFGIAGAVSLLAVNNNGNTKPNESEMIDRYNKIVNQIKSVVETYVLGGTSIEEKTMFETRVATVKYGAVRNTLLPRFAKLAFKADESKCVGCNVCVKACPTNNIRLVKNKIKFSSNCITCGKCINICPENAYKVSGKPYQQFDMKQKPILEQVTV